MSMAKRLIGGKHLAKVPQNRPIQRIQRKQIRPSLYGSHQRPASIFEALQLKVGERQVVLHLRGVWSQLRGSLEWFQRLFKLTVLSIENPKCGQLFGVVWIVELITDGGCLFAGATVQFLRTFPFQLALLVASCYLLIRLPKGLVCLLLTALFPIQSRQLVFCA